MRHVSTLLPERMSTDRDLRRADPPPASAFWALVSRRACAANSYGVSNADYFDSDQTRIGRFAPASVSLRPGVKLKPPSLGAYTGACPVNGSMGTAGRYAGTRVESVSG